MQQVYPFKPTQLDDRSAGTGSCLGKYIASFKPVQFEELPASTYDACIACAEAGKAKNCSGTPSCHSCFSIRVPCVWIDRALYPQASPVGKKESRKDLDARVARENAEHQNAVIAALAKGVAPPPGRRGGRPKGSKTGTGPRSKSAPTPKPAPKASCSKGKKRAAEAVAGEDQSIKKFRATEAGGGKDGEMMDICVE